MKNFLLISAALIIISGCNNQDQSNKEIIIKEQTQTIDTTMNTKDYSATLLVDQTPKEVYDAINNVRGWWQGEIIGNTDKVNDEFSYRVEGIHYSNQKVEELIPNKKIVWLVTDSKLEFIKQKDEWTGTKLVFEISEVNNKTQLRFTHTGLVPEIECYNQCSGAWNLLVKESLFSYITTGKGKKVF